MVSILVREDVRLGERPAASAELRLELVEEPEVDVDVAVARTVERARRRRRRAASRLDPVLEEARLRRLVAPKRAVPVRLHAVDDSDDPAVLTFVRIGTGLAVRGELARRRARPDRLARERPEIPQPAPAATEEEEREQDHDPDEPPAAAQRDGKTAGQTTGPLSPVVLDLRRVEPCPLAKTHRRRRTPDTRYRNPRTGSGSAVLRVRPRARAPARPRAPPAPARRVRGS